ncbi:MAG: hypothetical protein EXR99_13270 [Gemmataceae bacterium]|nr:hypothetical protein [Gemmataceae bacterium]
MNTPKGQALAAMMLALLVGVALVFTLVYLLAGLFRARTLLRREFLAYFLSPVAYVVLVVFLGVTGYLFGNTFDLLTASGPKGAEFPLQAMFGDERFWLVFLFIPPLLTMRLFAEERSSGTLEMLMTAPLTDWQVVLCKYLACLGFYTVLWLPTLFYLPALLGWTGFHLSLPAGWAGWSLLAGLLAILIGLMSLAPTNLETRLRLAGLWILGLGLAAAVAAGVVHYQTPGPHLASVTFALDPFPVLSTYFGMFLAGAMFLSIGILVSSMVRDQMVSALVSMGLGLLLIGAGFWKPEQDGGLLFKTVYFFSVPLHFERSFTRGIIDTRPVILYASTAIFCLFLTVRSLESRRWRS